MPANSSFALTNLDFDTLRNSLRTYLQSQDRFRDYDFTGSNMAVLLDILSYNTYHNAFYLNMVASEMFLDTAQLTDSVVSHAKELNYLPRSFTSAQAEINITIVSSNPEKSSLTIPRGTQFSSRVGQQVYTFSTEENIAVVGNGTFVANAVLIYEGDVITEAFNINASENQHFTLSNPNLDTSSIKVSVIEDSGATTHEYLRALSLFGHDEDSKVFFVQGASEGKYEVVFGDDVIGRRPKDNSTILVEYRLSNGELPNGATVFKPVSTIDGETSITVTTETSAHSGSISEDIESIRFNAPRHFTTQERAVTTEDYENLLTINFPEINSVTAFGGEELTPPKFGKVYISVDLRDVDGIPDVKKAQYYNFLKPRCPVSFEPVIVDPEYMYIGVITTVKYDITTTALNQEDIKTLIISAILEFAEANLNDFNKTLRFSRLIRAIDEADPSVISNETSVRAIKVLVDTALNSEVNFGIAIENITSTEMSVSGKRCFLKDDGSGTLNLLSATTGQTITNIGTVDYTTGTLTMPNFIPTDVTGSGIKVYATPVSDDISTTKNVVLNIVSPDIITSIVRTRT